MPHKLRSSNLDPYGDLRRNAQYRFPGSGSADDDRQLQGCARGSVYLPTGSQLCNEGAAGVGAWVCLAQAEGSVL